MLRNEPDVQNREESFFREHEVSKRSGLLPLSDECCEPPSPTLRHVIVERDEFKIRLADTAGQRSSSSLLIKRMYAWRGYETGTASEDNKSNVVTLVAHTNDAAERMIGTLTLWFDCPGGLPADAAYKDRLDALRDGGRKLCEPGGLAIDPAAMGSKPLLATLIHLTCMYIQSLQGHSDMVVQVNPRHSAFYQRMLGFTRLGESRTCAKVNAPAVLLTVATEYMQAEIEKHGGQAGTSEKRSLYPYFFSAREEKGLSGRLWTKAASGVEGGQEKICA